MLQQRTYSTIGQGFGVLTEDFVIDRRLHHPPDEAHPARSRPRHLLQAAGGGARAQGSVCSGGICARLHAEQRDWHARCRPGDQGLAQVYGRMFPFTNPNFAFANADVTNSSTPSPSTSSRSSRPRLPSARAASAIACPALRCPLQLPPSAWRSGALELETRLWRLGSGYHQYTAFSPYKVSLSLRL